MATPLLQYNSQVEYHSSASGQVTRTLIDVATAENVDAWYAKAAGSWVNYGGNSSPLYLSTDTFGGYWTFIGHSRPFDYLRTRMGTPAVVGGTISYYYITPKGVFVPFTPRAFSGVDQSDNFFESSGPINELFWGAGAQAKPPVDWGLYQHTWNSVDMGRRYWIAVLTSVQPTPGGTGIEAPLCRVFKQLEAVISRASVWDNGGDGGRLEIRLGTQFGAAGGAVSFRHGTKTKVGTKTIDVFFPGGCVIPRNMQGFYAVITNSTGGIGTRNGNLTYVIKKGTG